MLEALSTALPADAWWLPAALALATLASEDLTCIAAGTLVARGTLGFVPAAVGCAAGIWLGDLLLVLLGRTLGAGALGRAPMRWWISPARVARSEVWFVRRAAWLLLASRFLPGTRLPIYFAAGTLRIPLPVAAGWLALGSLVWTPLLVGLGALFGSAAQAQLARWLGVVPGLALSAVAAWLVVRLAVALGTWRGRRLLYGRWRRLTRWEYWPIWALYLPVVGYVLWLALRHRSLTLVTATNPGIERGGGLCGESKSRILAGLAAAGDRVAAWRPVPPGALAERRAAVVAFMAERELAFPLVLKPDVGERGRGVVIAREARQLDDALAAHPAALIAQAYVPGVEFGVFYYRFPSAARGEIFAVTEKRLPVVVGDGRQSLEQLILADERGAAQAPLFLGEFAAELDRVPAADERVALAELGAHCRGALFLDGAQHVTPELGRAIDGVSRALAGFHFGRYDVRTPSPEAFRRGEFTVIELNGLTSEATSIYDPRHSVWHGWRTLCRQWRLAFAIATENRAAGAPPLGLRATLRLLRPAPSLP